VRHGQKPVALLQLLRHARPRFLVHAQELHQRLHRPASRRLIGRVVNRVDQLAPILPFDRDVFGCLAAHPRHLRLLQVAKQLTLKLRHECETIITEDVPTPLCLVEDPDEAVPL